MTCPSHQAMCGRIIQASPPDQLALKIVHALEDREVSTRARIHLGSMALRASTIGGSAYLRTGECSWTGKLHPRP